MLVVGAVSMPSAHAEDTIYFSGMEAIQGDFGEGNSTINGQTYPSSIMHLTAGGDSQMEAPFTSFPLRGKCSKVEATLGINDSSGEGPSSRFEIYLDDRLAFNQTIEAGQSIPLVLDVTGTSSIMFKLVWVQGDSVPAFGDARATCVGLRPKTLTIATNVTQITAGNAPLLSGVARDAEGSAVSDAPVTVYENRNGSQYWVPVATVQTDPTGNYSLLVRPTMNTRYVVAIDYPGTRDDAASDDTVLIGVYTRVNVDSPAVGSTVGRRVTFRGGLSPAFDQVAVGVAYIDNGRYTYLGQAMTTRGAFSLSIAAPLGTHTFVVYTSAHAGTGKGTKSLTVTSR